MVTLSHYLLNASTVIGGFAGLAIKKEASQDQIKRLEVIKAESERIEAIVGSIQSLKSIATENYGTDSETLMFDIKSRIEQHLEESKKELIDKNRAA
jgi:signal transduction histidine kinase